MINILEYHFMEIAMHRLLPPVLLIMLSTGLIVLHFFHPLMESSIGITPWLALAMIVVAIAGLARARFQFARSESEIMTFNVPRNLVTDGLFSISRNPMYLLMLLLITGAALLVDRWCGLLAPVVFFVAANWWYVPFEERAAAESFGDSYLDYRQKVRRWL
jgi:protein-S-isoprenylcysteine O-methyltransferase Ste14